MPEKLYLRGFKREHYNATIKAVRDARGVIYKQPNPSIGEAKALVDALRDKRVPQLVGEHDDVEVLTAAAALLTEADVLWEVNPIIETPENVIPEGADEEATPHDPL